MRQVSACDGPRESRETDFWPVTAHTIQKYEDMKVRKIRLPELSCSVFVAERIKFWSFGNSNSCSGFVIFFFIEFHFYFVSFLH